MAFVKKLFTTREIQKNSKTKGIFGYQQLAEAI
jgi:hypothetical protein